jgi:hypothetical protein
LATVEAVSYLRALRPDEPIPVYVGPPEDYELTARRWPSIAPRLGQLNRFPQTGPSVNRSLRRYLRDLYRQQGGGFVTVVIPEEIRSRSLLRILRRGSAFWLKASLFFEEGVVVTNVPLLPEERAEAVAHADRPLEPGRSVVVIPVSAVHAATARAVAYAESLNAASVEAVYFVTDEKPQDAIFQEWIDWGMTVPLSLVEAPFREYTSPILEEVRRHTRHPGTVVSVLLPELVVEHWWHYLLHNQTALFFKRVLLFEPRVVVTSVPFHLGSVSG